MMKMEKMFRSIVGKINNLKVNIDGSMCRLDPLTDTGSLISGFKDLASAA